ncbi:MAG: transporter substrate-binding domain-containing protein [Candidatus Delongbacteria bacterium]|nr:transporter substrate-binding domain-containing protein [Candidatus Delongbacteria bacterium]MBN2834815.1 transporter substrate-binding domain-containing protein [Candidatus Delongbacteria bacterium]
MKNIFFMLSLFMVLFSLSAKESMTFICEDKEDYPFVMGNGKDFNNDKPGVVVELLKIVENKMGVEFVFSRTPWKRALEVELKEGNVDGLFSASYKKEREEMGVYPNINGVVDPSKKLYRIAYSYYQLKSSPVDWDGKELKGFNGKIGAPRGYSIVSDLRSKGYTVEESDGCEYDLKKLQLNRVQLTAELDLQAENILNKNPELAKDIVKVTPPIVEKDYYLMLSFKFVENNKELADKFWKNLEEVRNAELEKIMEKY